MNQLVGAALLGGILLEGACRTRLPEATVATDSTPPAISVTAPIQAPAPAPAVHAGLRGVVDTVIMISAGSPFGAAASVQGLAYVTLHSGVSALVSWDFKRRRAVEHAVQTGVEPTNVAFDPSGDHAFVACQWSSALERVDVGRGVVDAEWATPSNDPYQVAISPDGKLAYVSGNSGYLHIFDAHSGALRGRVQVREAPNGLAVSADGRRVFITHLRSPEVGVVDADSGTYRAVGEMGAAVGQGIVLSKDERILFAVSQAAGRLYAFDPNTGAMLGSAATADSPFGLALTPDGKELWVTTLGGMLQRFGADPALSPLGQTPLGGRLRRIAMDPKGRGAVVADENGRVIVLK